MLANTEASIMWTLSAANDPDDPFDGFSKGVFTPTVNLLWSESEKKKTPSEQKHITTNLVISDS